MGANGTSGIAAKAAHLPRPRGRLSSVLYDFAARNWKVALYVLLILLCVLFAPEAPLKFIYTEF